MIWEQIRANRRKTAALILLLFILLVALGVVIAEAYMPGAGLVGGGIAVAVWGVMSLVAYYQGDNILLALSGAQEIEKDDHPMLFNVVEEMTIAAGLGKMPRVYIMDDMSLNAFATGRDPNNAAVAVTAGLLGRLNRDELQGVIAHEMSHVVNRDVLLMTMVGVLLGAIVMIADVYLRSMRYVGSGRRYGSSRGGGQAQAIMFIIALVLAILAPLLAQLIYFAISRRREYLADASAAVLTRYPEGLASALQAIADDAQPLARANRATAPMYIASPFREEGMLASSLSSTHPPLEERIKILRTMAGGISFSTYDAAWRQIRGKRNGVLPTSTLAQGETVQARSASTAAQPQDARTRMRDAGDLLRKVNQFLFLTCACGLRIKVPPTFKHGAVKCPRCGQSNEVPVAQAAAAAQVGTALAAATNDASDAPLVVQRLPGQWCSFRCTCGKAMSLPPTYEAAWVNCRSCGRGVRLSNTI